VVVGGTGLYVDSLLGSVQFSECSSDEAYRAELAAFAAENGNEALHARLAELDPEAAGTIHPNNLVRVIRALEVCRVTGKKFSEVKAESRREESPYDVLMIGLNFADRAALYRRTDLRVEKMVGAGLVEEARSLWESGGMRTSANAIGYKELIPYFLGEQSLEECIAKIQQETRRYAKRQLTWFRKNDRIQWIILDEFAKLDEISEKSQKCIAKFWKI